MGTSVRLRSHVAIMVMGKAPEVGSMTPTFGAEDCDSISLARCRAPPTRSRWRHVRVSSMMTVRVGWSNACLMIGLSGEFTPCPLCGREYD